MKALDAARWQRIEDILDRILDLGDAERRECLDRICVGEPALRAEVDAFLAADGRRQPLLDSGLGELADSLLREAGGAPHVEPPARLSDRTRLGPYEIVCRVGAGGMGEVYRARDITLGREVALKVLRDDAAADDDRMRRFEREARAASALNHPNIVTIHGVGEDRDVRYIVMEYVEGQTLRELLASGPLPVPQLLSVASQVASGLAKAHAAGMVHRDLKPENLMVSADGFAKILDFGLTLRRQDAAQDGAVGADGANAEARPDETRPFVGTLAYMSPEQVRGTPVDFRSDQFSLGAILYELATAQPAFRKPTARATLTAIAEGEPDPPLGGDLSRRFRQLVDRCLEKDRERRFGSTAELARELQQLRQGDAPPVQAAAIDSLAILPLIDLSEDSREEHFADGMTEALIADLARIGGLRVISRTSVMPLKGSREPLPQIAAKLGVDGIVEGSVLRAGNRVRIIAQLIHGPTDSHLWAETYEREFRDVLALQADVARAIARQIQLSLDHPEHGRAKARPTIDPEAHEHYLLGRHQLAQRTMASLDRSVGHFEQAIERAPDYAPAHAGLADALAVLAGAGHGVSPEGLVERARQAADRALELDEMLAAAHTSLAFLRFKFDHDWQGAERAFRRALELSPSDSSAHHWYALFLGASGRHQEARRHIETALRLDPLSVIIRVAASRVCQWARDFEAGIDHARQTLELQPGYAEAHFNLGMCFLHQQDFEQAFRELETALKLAGERPLQLAMLGNAYARAGMPDEAGRILERLHQKSATEPVAPSTYAILYLGLGDRERALQSIEQAVAQHEGMAAFIGVDALLDDMRDEPRFQACLRRLGLS